MSRPDWRISGTAGALAGVVIAGFALVLPPRPAPAVAPIALDAAPSAPTLTDGVIGSPMPGTVAPATTPGVWPGSTPAPSPATTAPGPVVVLPPVIDARATPAPLRPVATNGPVDASPSAAAPTEVPAPTASPLSTPTPVSTASPVTPASTPSPISVS